MRAGGNRGCAPLVLHPHRGPAPGEKSPSSLGSSLILLLGSTVTVQLKASKSTKVISSLTFLHLERITASETQAFEGSFGQLRLAVILHLLPSFMNPLRCQQAGEEYGA